VCIKPGTVHDACPPHLLLPFGYQRTPAIQELAKYFGVYDQISVRSGLGALPVAVWEFSLGVYLTAKGFKRCRITDEITAARTQQPAATSRLIPAP
jgi:hypothetical protein